MRRGVWVAPPVGANCVRPRTPRPRVPVILRSKATKDDKRRGWEWDIGLCIGDVLRRARALLLPCHGLRDALWRWGGRPAPRRRPGRGSDMPQACHSLPLPFDPLRRRNSRKAEPPSVSSASPAKRVAEEKEEPWSGQEKEPVKMHRTLKDNNLKVRALRGQENREKFWLLSILLPFFCL